MSQHAQLKDALRRHLSKHCEVANVVLDVFVDTVDAAEWDCEQVVDMLEYSFGVSTPIVDKILRCKIQEIRQYM